MPLILRRAIAADAAEVAEVYLRSRNTLASYAPLAHSEAAVRDWVANVLVPSGNVTVAVNDNRIVGMRLRRRGLTSCMCVPNANDKGLALPSWNR